ncbi:N-acetylmuramoyl-L-alanine amidase [Nocardioides sp. ChNu-99]|uniref:peptidoglycan recognition protein family protein n=1 Tax=Nocardioides sp. ChNu-99 TaxID=2839897 RepID=UPI002404C10C|nr:N-acetylmuramoyl-L-alanine amidase [Nocardioides sp. ChNu-99]MDF9716045.1 N-acetylmuramoyl-L-alanine amidase [Nocardioides sp. ChNu-99]
MALTALPADLPARLTAAGCEVALVGNWRRNKRLGAFRPVGVLWHHTGGEDDGAAYARWLAHTGRPENDLPAPLCQLSIGRDGTVYVLAAGRANHGGKARASGTVAAGDANTLYVGVECHNTGSEGWSAAQHAAMVKVGVVLARVLGTSAAAQRGHRETSVTGKWDPGKLDLDAFRAAVARQLTAAPARPATLGPLAKIGVDRWLAAEETAEARPTAANKAKVAVLRAPLTVAQLDAAYTWKAEQKAAAARRGENDTVDGRERQLGYIRSLKIRKGA